MSGRSLDAVVRHVSRLAQEAAVVALPDAELLRRFASSGDETAFTALVGRHGALVWSVCSTVLGHEQDAEDAFQATFLVLARRPRAVRKENSVASWLYGVARRVACKARTAATRRRAREQRPPAATPEGPASVAALRELQVILHEEVERLPARYRAPLVLCCLQGVGREAAARELGWKEGTLSARLTHARRLLERGLVRRGVALSAALYASAIGGASAGAPVALLDSTIDVALLLARGEAAGAGSARAVTLAEGVTGGMFTTRLTTGAALLLALATLATGAGVVLHQPPREARQPDAEASTPKPPQGPDLVRAFRQRQEWIQKVKSFSVRWEGTITGADGRKIPEVVEVAFDARRVRHTLIRKGFDEELHAWDGKRNTTHVRSASGAADRYFYTRDAQEVGDGTSAGLQWLWGQPHQFWWTRPEKDPDRAKLIRDTQGQPDEFAITGRTVYRGVPCFVLQKKGFHMVRLYVGEKTGHLHGRMEQSLPGNPQADREAIKVAAAEGKKLGGFDEFLRWYDTLPKAKWQPLWHAVCVPCYPTDHPRQEAWFLDYEEVKPGCWFPKTQGYAGYKGTHAKPITEHHSEARAVKVTVDAPLPESLFAAPPLKDGADVYDATTDPPLTYKYKKDRTRAEWDALRAEARKLQAEERKAKARRDELVGKPALPLPQDGWLDGKARSWASLKGKPVVLFFWAEWCGPCHGFLPLLRIGEDEGANVTVLGIHAPGSDRADVERVMKQEKATAPVCIDKVEGKGAGSAGAQFTGYRLPGLPSAVLVDADGKVAALGDPNEVMQRMRELLRAAREKHGK